MRYSLLLLSAVLLSCGDEDVGVTAPDTGSLEIRATTSGEAGADYMVAIDGAAGRALPPNGSFTVPDLEPGFHVVQIVAPPPGCTIAGDNPRTVSVDAGAINVVTFAVTCVPLLGSIQVTTVTTGAGPATYDLVMDGTSVGPIGPSATRTIDNVPPGAHTITLDGVPATCQVQGGLPQTVTVEPSSSAPLTFSISCTPPPAGTGTLNVTVSTSGDNSDPDGYLVSVDGGALQPIGSNATVPFPDLAAGNHTIRLDGVAANCAVSGPNPQTITVPAGGSATVTFAVTCAAPQPTTGTLRITTTTTGGDVDPDGYTLVLDGEERGDIDGEGSRTFRDLAVGEHTVELTGVAENCAIEGDNPLTVAVTAGEQVEAEFVVTCTAETGALRVRAQTSGPDSDPDGYALWLDDEQQAPIDSNEEEGVLLDNLAPGDYSVEVRGVAENCEVGGENPRIVTITAGETAETEFVVTCSATTGSIHVTVTTEGTPEDAEFALTLDAGEPQPIQSDGELTLEVSEGSHQVLLEVASNCTVTDDETRTVEVVAGETEEVSYSVECTSPSAARR